jgi:hypothetical protein
MIYDVLQGAFRDADCNVPDFLLLGEHETSSRDPSLPKIFATRQQFERSLETFPDIESCHKAADAVSGLEDCWDGSYRCHCPIISRMGYTVKVKALKRANL